MGHVFTLSLISFFDKLGVQTAEVIRTLSALTSATPLTLSSDFQDREV